MFIHFVHEPTASLCIAQVKLGSALAPYRFSVVFSLRSRNYFVARYSSNKFDSTLAPCSFLACTLLEGCSHYLGGLGYPLKLYAESMGESGVSATFFIELLFRFRRNFSPLSCRAIQYHCCLFRVQALRLSICLCSRQK